MTTLGPAEHSAPPAASASSTVTLPPWDNTTVRGLFVETYKQDQRIRNLYLLDHLLQIQAQNPTREAGKLRQELDVLMVKYDDVAKGQPDPLDASLVSGEETLQKVTMPWLGPLERFIGVPLDLAKKAFDIEGKLEAEKRFNGHTFISEMIDKYSIGVPGRAATAYGASRTYAACLDMPMKERPGLRFGADKPPADQKNDHTPSGLVVNNQMNRAGTKAAHSSPSASPPRVPSTLRQTRKANG